MTLRSVISMFILVASAPLFGALTLADEQGTTDELALERRPYEVRLLVAFDSRSFDEAASQKILRDLDLSARRSVGELWNLKIRVADWLNPVNPAGLERIDLSQIAFQYPGETADLWFAATVEKRSAGTRVNMRSWLPETQTETSTESTHVSDQREVTAALLRLCRHLFRPLGYVEHGNDRQVSIRLRAGEIEPPDPSFVQLTTNDILLPLIAYRGKHGTIDRLQTIPWTYVTIDEVDGSTIQGTVQSGVKFALGGKKRGRTDTIVIGLRPQHPSTQIELMTQSKPQRPLVAHRIEVRTEPNVPRQEDGKPPVDFNSTLISELITDRRGQTTVAAEPGQPLVWLFAFSGQNLLARVPFVPGVSKQVALEVPDDATRLAAEADLQMLQSEIVDAVALRNTAIATMRAAAKKNDWETVDLKLDTIKRQQDVGSFYDRLTSVRVAGTAAAKARKDRTAEIRIGRMCDELKTLLDAHLSDDKVTAISDEMASLRSADQPPDEKPRKKR